MIKNVGGTDRIIRIVLGLALLSLPPVLHDELRWWGLIGFVPLFTGLAGWCPAYRLFGISSCAAPARRPR